MTYLAQLKAKLSEKMPLHTPDKTDKRLPSVLSVALGGVFPKTDTLPISSGNPHTWCFAEDNDELAELLCLPKGWSLEDWIWFEERAAILEFDGGFSRTEAEHRAAVEFGLEPPAVDQAN